MNKFLYCIAILSVAVFSNVEVNASTPLSLRDLFNEGSKTIEFNENGTVYYYDTVQPEKKTTLNKDQYIDYNYRFYIYINTIPLLNNTEGEGSKGKYKKF